MAPLVRCAALLAALAVLLIVPSASAAERNAFGVNLAGAAAQLAAAAAAPPPGFEETIALSGLTNPTAVR